MGKANHNACYMPGAQKTETKIIVIDSLIQQTLIKHLLSARQQGEHRETVFQNCITQS